MVGLVSATTPLLIFSLNDILDCLVMSKKKKLFNA